MSNPKYSGHVLVLGHGTRVFLSVIRSLGRAGLTVHVGMCPRDDLSVRSKYTFRHHEIPEYVPDDSGWIAAVESVLSDYPIQLVVPCHDPSAIPIQLYHERLSRRTRVHAIPDHAFSIVSDKIETFHLAQQLGIPQARGMVISPGDDFAAALNTFPLPVVLKPPSSFHAANTRVRRSVREARTRDLALALLAEMTSAGKVLIQENFVGSGVGVEVLADHGEILVAFQHERIHEPLDGGGSSYRKSVSLDPELLAASAALMRSLAYTGVAMVEYKRDRPTGTWALIEINGRFWGSLPLAVAAGADFPLYLYELLVHSRREFPQTYREGLYCRNIASDIEWLRSNLSANRSDATLCVLPWHSVFNELWNIATFRERWDTLASDDLWPGAVSCARYTTSVCRRCTRAALRRLSTTSLARTVASRRLQSIAKTAQHIHFVCKGNICRSPFAERYARRVFPPYLTVTSSGYYPTSERLPPSVAIEAADKFGVDMRSHRSRTVDLTELESADAIFTFDDHNFRTLHDGFPTLRSRLFRLSSFTDSRSPEIVDPYGGTFEEFEQVYRVICRAVDTVVNRFCSTGTAPSFSDSASAIRGPFST